uniref:Uncharacterized protein n=2 Tax=unclassified Salmonella TaxID=2614656 RepID=I3W3R5_9ENTR|nr:hypothetical protein [Salmonella sp. 14]AFK90242.1 hypothetical protein [Salmonella sp. 40]
MEMLKHVNLTETNSTVGNVDVMYISEGDEYDKTTFDM